MSEPYKGLRKGGEISCQDCNEVIYLASRDIPFAGEMLSANILYADGRQVEFGAKTVCPACGNGFTSISTTKGRTIG